MTIRFPCKCGKVLMAEDDQVGLEGKCPACGEVMQIPPAVEATETERFEDPLFEAPGEPGEMREDESLETEVLEEMGEAMEEMDEPAEEMDEPVDKVGEPRDEMDEPVEDYEDYPEYQARKGGRVLTSRFAMLVSIVVVVVVALVVFMFVRKEREAPEEVVVIEKIQPAEEAEEEASTVAVGAMGDEEKTVPEIAESEEPPEIISPVTEPEPVEPAISEPETGVESEVASGSQELQTVVSTAGETPPVEESPPTERVPPAGSFTVNVASFREKDNADRYLEELKKSGIDAYDWEIDLPQKGKWYRVSVGGFPSRKAAEDYANELKQKGLSDIFVTQVPGTS